MKQIFDQSILNWEPTRIIVLALAVLQITEAFAASENIYDDGFYTIYNGFCHIPVPLQMSFEVERGEFYFPRASFSSADEKNIFRVTKRISVHEEFALPKSISWGDGRVIEPRIEWELEGVKLYSFLVSDENVSYVLTMDESAAVVFYDFTDVEISFVFEICESLRDRRID
ncbi:hypothetical protein [Parahalioglobus pacificus]|uniref:hypothetical protein n=1 Tax=Parahalioglobus pacificus TaxID=930806 RepID=UPI00167266F5|nr:hypothetical protein [Halioglobus pacificus]